MNHYPNRWLHRFACLLTLATLILIIAGATVTSHRAGLSVPDWPTTYGQFMFSFPTSKWVGNILYEHGHRLIASAVGMLTIILAFWLVRKEPRRWVRRLGIVALAVVIAQGLLGGLTVIRLLPPPISIAHAGLAEMFFCITVALAFVTSPNWLEQGPSKGCHSDPAMAGEESLSLGPLKTTETLRSAQGDTPAVPAAVRWLSLATTVVVYCQIILGAAIRHSESGVLAHILGAALVFGCVVASMALVLFTVRQKGFLRDAILLVCLVTAQIALGLTTLMVRLPKNTDAQLAPIQVLVPTAHLALGALILATSLVITLKTFRCLTVPKEEPAMPFAAGALS